MGFLKVYGECVPFPDAVPIKQDVNKLKYKEGENGTLFNHREKVYIYTHVEKKMRVLHIMFKNYNRRKVAAIYSNLHSFMRLIRHN